MSEPVASAADPEVPPYHEPDFDRQEVDGFSHEDGHAVFAIGRMLVLFFFYSLIVMLGVGIWTALTFRFDAARPEPEAPQTAPHAK